MKYHIITWGCQMNEHDSEKIAGMLEKMGHTPTKSYEEADIIVFNTCCVRENAELKVFSSIGNLKRLKNKNPNLVIAVCGCMVQQKHVAHKIHERFPFVDIVLGTHNTHRFPEILECVVSQDQRVIEIWDESKDIVENIPAKRDSNIKAWVTISFGCNNFCSYCIVPYVRGRERSRKPQDIIKEVKKLAEEGFKEVTLLGQNVNSYGKDLSEEVRFSDLLYKVNEIPGIERIRFMTSHPKDLSDDLIKAIKECKKICEHIHLPVQSGSTSILKKMNRNYTKEHYLGLTEKIYREIPGVSITTDIIVGFPGETEEDFEDTLDVVERIRFDSAFTFMYSKRKGTPAAKMENQVPDEVKKERLQRLMDLQNRISKEKNMKLKDKIIEVLIEGYDSKKNLLVGRTRTDKLVYFEGEPKRLSGKLVKVKITTPKTWTLEGVLVAQ